MNAYMLACFPLFHSTFNCYAQVLNQVPASDLIEKSGILVIVEKTYLTVVDGVQPFCFYVEIEGNIYEALPRS